MNKNNYEINGDEDFLKRFKRFEEAEKKKKIYCKKYHMTEKGKSKRRLASCRYYWRKVKKAYHPIYNKDFNNNI